MLSIQNVNLDVWLYLHVVVRLVEGFVEDRAAPMVFRIGFAPWRRRWWSEVLNIQRRFSFMWSIQCANPGARLHLHVEVEGPKGFVDDRAAPMVFQIGFSWMWWWSKVLKAKRATERQCTARTLLGSPAVVARDAPSPRGTQLISSQAQSSFNKRYG